MDDFTPMSDHDFLVPDWPAPPSVHALCSTRAGGVSSAPWDSLNLGDHVGDDPAAVRANREAFARRVGVRPVYLRQVHGTALVDLEPATPDGTEADACVATAPGVACTVMVADCLPLLYTDTRGSFVAAAHAGWRGLAGEGVAVGRGVLEVVMGRFDAGRTLAWLGPCIGPDAFEVGPEVKAAFERFDPASRDFFKPHREGKWLADLPGLARSRLRALGVRGIHGNDGSAAWCTVASASRFFSHRRDRTSGRFAASVWLG